MRCEGDTGDVRASNKEQPLNNPTLNKATIKSLFMVGLEYGKGVDRRRPRDVD